MTMIAIVGSQADSFKTREETACALELLEMIFTSWGYGEVKRVHTLVSGRSPGGGVDIWAEQRAEWNGWERKIFPAEENNWPAYRRRNMQIAEACEVLYAIRSKTSGTYGSGWTADYAQKLGKVVYRFYV